VEGTETTSTTRAGKKIRTMNEVHDHFKDELPATAINADEALWLRIL